MSIATEIQELTQNTAELDEIRTDIRTALAGKGVDASTHNFADFPNDVESIPSGGTDGQFFPMNMLEYVLPKMTLGCVEQDYEQAVMINISGTNYISSGGTFYTPGTGTNSVYYCDFGSSERRTIFAVKTAQSNRFRIAFFNDDPSTFVSNTGGFDSYASDATTPAGTSASVISSGRYMVVGVSSENITTPAPQVFYKVIEEEI